MKSEREEQGEKGGRRKSKCKGEGENLRTRHPSPKGMKILSPEDKYMRMYHQCHPKAHKTPFNTRKNILEAMNQNSP